MNPIFTINNLECGYALGNPVLEIPALTIPKGKLVFVIGASGGGKSTLLETLGLMNKTVLSASCLNFHEEGDDTISLDALWEAKDDVIDAFRKKHFSFIFQKTNLMPNFTCGENMMLPALFKGQQYGYVRQRVFSYMEELKMRSDIFGEKISNISGGQRQRLAFIRAMVADFTILFGDEPTGNLDPTTARIVMDVLKRHLIATEKTGIVVSHDIGLAIEFADMIVPITMVGNGEQKKGVVVKDNLLFAKGNGGWSTEKTEYSQIEAHLKQLIA